MCAECVLFLPLQGVQIRYRPVVDLAVEAADNEHLVRIETHGTRTEKRYGRTVHVRPGDTRPCLRLWVIGIAVRIRHVCAAAEYEEPPAEEFRDRLLACLAGEIRQ